MDIKRQRAVALVGTSVGLGGCQSAPLRGLAFWNKNDSASLASASPDVGKQRFDGLSKQLSADQPRAVGQAKAGAAPLGGQKPAENDNFFTSSWKKATGAVAGTLAAKPKTDESNEDPLRLDNPVRKVGPEVYVSAARFLENQGKVAEAQIQYEKALQASPRDVGALVSLARLHDRQGNWQKAVELYQQAIAANPASGLVYNDLGLCFARQHQHQASLQAMSKAVELQPGNPKYRNNIAAVLVDLGQTDEAFKHLAAASAPAVAHYNLGYLLQQQGQQAEAVQHFQQALALDPALAPAREMIARISGQQMESVAAQPVSRPAAPPAAAQTAVEPHAPLTKRLSYEETVEPDSRAAMPYFTEPASLPVPTAAPQTSAARAPKAPSNFHIGDDEPAAETAPSRWKWESDWPSASDQAGAGTVQPLQ